MFCTKKEKIANHCLVICIGICKYSKNTAIPNCDNVSNDIETYTNTFKQNPNYTVISNDYSQIYTKENLTNYLSSCFCNNLYDSSTNNIKYNTLIITISGHCTQNSIICSNGDKFAFTEILCIFTGKWKHKNLIINLPKFLIIDGQRGFNYFSQQTRVNDEKNDDIAYIEAHMNDESITDTYCAILCSVSQCLDSTVYGGTLCMNICSIFTQNMKLKNDIMFYDIIKQLRHRLSAIDDYQYCIDFVEHDMDIDDVLFTSKQNKIQRSASMSVLSAIHRRDRNNKKSASSKALSPRILFQKRTQSIAETFKTKRTKTKTCVIPPDESEYIDKDPMFKDVMEWDKSIETMSKTKDKRRVRVQWMFVIDNEGHSVSLLHSQKRNPYNKAKRVLFIDGKQIWNQKSTATQFTEMYKGNVLMICIAYNEEKKEYKYDLKINNKTHKQLFKIWYEDLLGKTFVD